MSFAVAVDDQFRAVAAEHPSRPAVRTRGRTVSFGELDHRVDALVHRLAGAGVGPGATVAVASADRFDYVVALLAVLRAGAVYVPLDCAAPAERTAFVLADTGAAVLVADERGRTLAAGRTVVDPAGPAVGASGPTRNGQPPADGAPSPAAYVIYTSGTTGTPKGVRVGAAALDRHIPAIRRRFGISAADVVLHLARPTVDVAVEQILATLTAGACLVVAGGALLSPEEFVGLLDAERVTVANVPAGYFQELAVAVRRTGRVPATLRTMISGSDRLSPQAAAAWREATGIELLNAYGPTETTVTATVHTVSAAPAVPADAGVPLGAPVDERTAYVLDESMRPCPAEMTGELYVGGTALADGYWDRAALTADRFVPDPFATTPGARMYRTGDVVSQRDDGVLRYVGRRDDQVKIRGFRVELGEIETALGAHPDVASCAVSVWESDQDRRRLAAYVTLTDAAAGSTADNTADSTADNAADRPVLDLDELRDFLGRTLPEYMIPASVTVLDALPLTATGKVDRAALPRPDVPVDAAVDTAGDAADDTAGVPASPAERLLAGIWSEVLGVAGVSREDNFFHLGGDSLTAVQVASRVFEVFGPVSPHVIFDVPILADLAAAVSGAAGGTAGGVDAGPAAPSGSDETADPDRATLERRHGTEAPLSRFQRGLWLLDCWNPGTALYNVPWVLRFTGEVDPAVLHRCLETIVDRHEILRTSIVTDTDTGTGDLEPRLVVHDRVTVPFLVTDLSTLPPADRAARRAELVDAEAGRPFDLAEGPLVRAHVIRTAVTETTMVLVLHHIVWDEGSLRVLERELRELYAAHLDHRDPALPELPVQYSDYSRWLAENGVDEAARDHWREHLRGAPEQLAVPTDRPRPAVQTFAGARHEVPVDPALAAAVRELARAEGATPFMVLLAGLVRSVHRRQGTDDLVIGAPVSLRGRTELENMIGYFVNLLPLRFQVAAGMSFRDVVRHVREVALGGYRSQDVPFDEITDLVLDERPLDRNPLFQLSFELHTAAAEPAPVGGAGFDRYLHVNAVSRFDAAWSVEDTGTGLHCRIEYNSDLFEPATIARQATDWLTELSAGLAAPDTHAADAHAPDSDRQRTSVPALFDAQADRAPDRTAVSLGSRAFTYAQLRARANRLARHLADTGVRPGDPVAILGGGSIDLVTATLAVLKAGAAYVPLTADQPSARIGLIMEQTGASVLLVDAASAAGRIARDEGARGTRIVVVDEVLPDAAGLTAADPGVPVDPESLAYVIFTSGSTGRPKGVAVSHQNVVDMALDSSWVPERHARVLMHSSYAFDASTYEMWLPLLHGGTVVVAERGGADVLELAREIVEHGVTAAYFTVALFNLMAEECLDALGALREVWTGGDVASAQAIQRVLDHCPDTTVVHVYGPTETTLWCSAQSFEVDNRTLARLNLGAPMDDTRMYALDGRLVPVPVGGSGELYVAGRRLARGYVGRAGLTAERFLPDPFGGAGQRMYRTGDVVRRVDDDTFEFVGRVDEQVKIRGFRIELAEIHHALRRHPAVADCVVAVHDPGGGDRQLAAYVVPADRDRPPGYEQIHEHLTGLLPEYMVPSTLTVLDALPLTGNGKVDRAALPAPTRHGTDLVASLTADPTTDPAGDPIAADEAATPIERLVADVWAEILTLDTVHPHDNFFRLGGNSLAAVRVAMRLSKQIGVRIPPRLVFAGRTVRGLAELIPAN